MQPGGPEHLVVIEPALHIAQRGGIERVEAELGDTAFAHETGAPEHAQVLRDGGAADGKEGRDFAGRAFPAPDGVEDGAPGGVGDGGEDQWFCNHMVT